MMSPWGPWGWRFSMGTYLVNIHKAMEKKHIKYWFKRNIYFGKPEIFHGKIYGIYDDPAG